MLGSDLDNVASLACSHMSNKEGVFTWGIAEM